MFRQMHGLVEVLAPEREVGAVHGEAGQQLGESVGDRGDLGTLVGGDPLDGGAEVALEAENLGTEDSVGDAALRLVDEGRPGDGVVCVAIAQPRVEGIEGSAAGRVDQHAVDVGQSVVPGGARGRPGGRQLLFAFQDLLDQHVRAAGRGAERVEVSARVGEAVRVVDSESVGETLVDPADDLRMRLIEDPRHLDPDAGEGVHREEAAVVEFRIRPPPVHQLVVLPRVHGGGIRVVVCGARCDREAILVVAEFTIHDLELGLVLVAEYGNPHLAAAELPVHVERLCILRVTTMRQQVPPPEALHRCRHSHMVGHDVDEHAHAELACRSGCLGEPLRAAAHVVDPRVVGHVVPVIRSLLRLQQRREIQPVGSEVVDVVRDRRCFREGKSLPDLKAVGGDRDAHQLASAWGFFARERFGAGFAASSTFWEARAAASAAAAWEPAIDASDAATE